MWVAGRDISCALSASERSCAFAIGCFFSIGKSLLAAHRKTAMVNNKPRKKANIAGAMGALVLNYYFKVIFPC